MGQKYGKAIGTIIKLLNIHEKLKEVSIKLEIELQSLLVHLSNSVSQTAGYKSASGRIVEFVYCQTDDGEHDYVLNLKPVGYDITYNPDLGKKLYALHKKTARNKRRLITVSKLISLILSSLDIKMMSSFEIVREKSMLCGIVI